MSKDFTFNNYCDIICFMSRKHTHKFKKNGIINDRIIYKQCRCGYRKLSIPIIEYKKIRLKQKTFKNHIYLIKKNFGIIIYVDPKNEYLNIKCKIDGFSIKSGKNLTINTTSKTIEMPTSKSIHFIPNSSEIKIKEKIETLKNIFHKINKKYNLNMKIKTKIPKKTFIFEFENTYQAMKYNFITKNILQKTFDRVEISEKNIFISEYKYKMLGKYNLIQTLKKASIKYIKI